MTGLEFGGALDEHLLADCDDVHEDEHPSDDERDFEQIVADRAEWLQS